METPDDWREQMLKSDETSRVLKNVDEEHCVSAQLDSEFASKLSSRRPFTSPAVAQEAARAVVEAEPDKFFCQGRTVPDGRFARAVRFNGPETWPYLLASPEEERRIRRRYGLRADRTLGDSSDRQRAALAAHLSRQELQVGTPDMIVWVAESGSVRWRDRGLRDILRCLGLPHLEDENVTIVLEYNKTSVGKPFHVPRAFDGIGWWPFELQTRCESEVGMTRPLDLALPGGEGYPESVHRSERFRVDVVEVTTIDD